MKNYKEVLKKRIMLFSVFAFVGVVILILNYYNFFATASDNNFSEIVTSFQSGILTSLTLIFVLLIIKYTKAIKNETKLKKLYNAENDERRKTIKQKSGGNVMLVSSVLILFGGIIAGYYNRTVFFSLVACAMFQLHLQLVIKLYYFKKY